MSVLLFVAYVLLIPFLIGTALNRFLYPGKIYNGRALLSGHVVMYAVFEILTCIAIKKEWKLTQITNLYTAICIVLVLLSLVLTVRILPRVSTETYSKARLSVPACVILGLLAVAFLNYRMFLPDLRNHSNYETVQVLLHTDYVYEHNPLTGTFLLAGMYPINKFMTYPVYLASLLRTTTMPAADTLQIWIPMTAILLSLVGAAVAYPMLSRILSGTENKRTRFFVPLYFLLLLLLATVRGTSGYGLLHEGIVGNTLLATLILPFALAIL